MNAFLFLKSNLFWVCSISVIVFSSLFILPETSIARPGGGHTYSGGSNSEDNSSSDDNSNYNSNSNSGSSNHGNSYSNNNDPFEWHHSNNDDDNSKSNGTSDLEDFCAVLLLFIISSIIGTIVTARNNRPVKKARTSPLNKTTAKFKNSYATSATSSAVYHKTHQIKLENNTRQQKINALIHSDKAFSEVLFLDFAHSLYHKFYTHINTPEMRMLTPFLSDNIVQFIRFEMNKTSPRLEVVVGSLHISDISMGNSQTNISVDFQSNYTTQQNGKSYRHILTERWLFVRNIDVLSASPKAMQELACPSCGAPNDFNDAGICGHCNTHVKAGTMNWMLNRIIVQDHQHYKIESLGTYAPEIGTDAPTILDPFLNDSSAKFISLHKIQNFTTYKEEFNKKIVTATFAAMYKAWSERDNWKTVRHLLSDRLYESNEFWIKLYQEKKYFNRLENIQLQYIEPVKISMDNHYESITVRIFASAIDYTEDQSGKLIGGNKKTPRNFSEYWTFIRKIGIEKPESQFNTKECPNCGAPADKMSDSAVCGYCSAKTNLGDFSWVLSNITQDEVYQG